MHENFFLEKAIVDLNDSDERIIGKELDIWRKKSFNLNSHLFEGFHAKSHEFDLILCQKNIREVMMKESV